MANSRVNHFAVITSDKNHHFMIIISCIAQGKCVTVGRSAFNTYGTHYGHMDSFVTQENGEKNRNVIKSHSVVL